MAQNIKKWKSNYQPTAPIKKEDKENQAYNLR